MVHLKQFLVVLLGSLSAAIMAFSPSPPSTPVPAQLLLVVVPRTLHSQSANTSSAAHRSRNSRRFNALYYKYLTDDDDDNVISSDDMGNVVMTRTTRKSSTTSTTTTSTTRAISSRISPIIELHSIQDYRNHILLNNNNKINNNNNIMATASPLCIIRFSAPWCKVCRSTDVAWERMASKFSSAAAAATTTAIETTTAASAASKPIKFFTVNLNHMNKNKNNDDDDDGRICDPASSGGTSALKDMLQIDRVPQGIIHHPALGIYERKVNLHRSNLSSLKKRLEQYLMLFDYTDSGNHIIQMAEEEDGFWNIS